MRLRTAIATATTAAVLATSGVAIAGATANSGGTAPKTTGAVPSAASAAPAVRPDTGVPGARLRRRIRRGAAAVILQTINIDRKTLRADLANGRTIAQIATSSGVDPQTVITALVTAATNKLNTAVQLKMITAARAAEIEQKLPARAANLVNNWHPKHLKKTAS